MSSLEKKLVDEIIKLGIPSSKAKAIVKNLSADDKSRALMDSTFLPVSYTHLRAHET